MKIKDVLLDAIINTYLFEIARGRYEAKQIITEQSPYIFESFVALFVFNLPDMRDSLILTINKHFWIIDEVAVWPDNKKPDKLTVYNWLVFDSSLHYDVAWVNGSVKRLSFGAYKDIPILDYDAEYILNKILDIIKLILQDIEEPNKFISVDNYL